VYGGVAEGVTRRFAVEGAADYASLIRPADFPVGNWINCYRPVYSNTAILPVMIAQKPAIWIGSSRDDLRAFPDEVRRVMGCDQRRAERR
jgi:hypothetical protein